MLSTLLGKCPRGTGFAFLFTATAHLGDKMKSSMREKVRLMVVTAAGISSHQGKTKILSAPGFRV